MNEKKKVLRERYKKIFVGLEVWSLIGVFEIFQKEREAWKESEREKIEGGCHPQRNYGWYRTEIVCAKFQFNQRKATNISKLSVTNIIRYRYKRLESFLSLAHTKRALKITGTESTHEWLKTESSKTYHLHFHKFSPYCSNLSHPNGHSYSLVMIGVLRLFIGQDDHDQCIISSCTT